MKKMTLKDIQQVSLDVMSHFHDFCVENNLRYSLAFGTMIGAVRHKGFIPWDDDIDVFMPRPDFERLRDIYIDSGDYAYFDYIRGDAYQLIGRICDMSKTYVQSTKPWINRDTGVWIDIFPIDCCEENLMNVQNACDRLRIIWKEELIIRHSMGSLSLNGTLLKKAAYCFSKIYKFVTWQTLASLMSERLNYISKYSWGDTNVVANLSHYAYKTKELWNIEDFENYILVPFENKNFYICRDYDRILKSNYGDYMQLPPENKRTKRHGTSSYWKNKSL